MGFCWLADPPWLVTVACHVAICHVTLLPFAGLQIRRGASLLRATHQLELLAQLQPGSRVMATTRGSRYSSEQDASATVQLAHTLAPDHDAAVLEFALATSLHHDGITGAVMV
jgi:hypothetical protein